MGHLDLTQAQADALIAMEEHRASDRDSGFPARGQSISLPLLSSDGREQFLLDLSRRQLDLSKVKMQTRARRVVVLVRLALGGPPHHNPHGQEVGTPHIHWYRAGYGDKWAFPVAANRFRDLTDLHRTLADFLRYCNVTRPPRISMRLIP